MNTIGFVLFDNLQTLDITGPWDAFDSANQWCQQQGRESTFQLHTVAVSNLKVKSEPGLTLLAEQTLADDQYYDWLLIPGGKGTREVMADTEIMQQIKHYCEQSSRVISICTGAYILAATGLINGKECCSHWRFIDDLAQRFPQVQFNADSLFIQQGKFYSSGGMTAGMDLSLWLIKEQLGVQAAQSVARELLVYLSRSGDQSQFATPISDHALDTRLTKLQQWLLKNLDKPISVDDMAENMALSPRHFRRVFSQQLEQSPKLYLESLRLEQGRGLLLSSSMQIEDIATQVGFSQGDVFRRNFKKRFSITPQEYRLRFS